MGGSSKSRGNTTTDKSINLNNGGFVTQGGGNITVTDGGAVKAALDFGGEMVEDLVGLGDDALRSNAAAVDDALSFGGDVIESFEDMAGDSISLVESQSAAALDFGQEALQGSLQFSDRALNQVTATSHGMLTTVKNMVENINTGETSEGYKVDRTLIYGLVALVALVLIVFMVRGRK